MIASLVKRFNPELDKDLDVPEDDFLEVAAERFREGWIPICLARDGGRRDVMWVRAGGGDEGE